MPLLVLSLLTRRLLLSSSGSGILPTHTRSSTTSGPEWTVQWGILMYFVIQRRLCAWCRACSLSGACWSRCRLRGGGVHGMDQYDLCSFFLWHFVGFGCKHITLALFSVFMTLFVILFRFFFSIFFVIYLWVNAWLNECLNKWWKMYAWMNVWKKIEKIRKNRGFCLF